MSYREHIVNDTGCDPADAGAVEELMRVERGTLDALDARTFRREARRAAAALADLRENDPEVAHFYEEAGSR